MNSNRPENNSKNRALSVQLHIIISQPMAHASERDLPYQRLPLMLSRDGLASQFFDISFSPREKLGRTK